MNYRPSTPRAAALFTVVCLTALHSSLAPATAQQGTTTPDTNTVELLQVEGVRALVGYGVKPFQVVLLKLRYEGNPSEGAVCIAGGKPLSLELKPGVQDVEVLVPAVETETAATLEVKVAGKTAASRQVKLKPVRKLTIYLLHHDHIDIGYTHPQPEVERLQWRNLDRALELCRETADYPPGARFKWNTEILWAVDSYLREEPPEKQQRLIDAVRAGQVGLDALYGNELTGLCRPEELLRLCECSQRLAKRCAVTVDAAMISDIPGYTWGMVPALAQAGVKYFSIAPNQRARIGRTLTTWSDKPFYWLSPDGRQKLLCWVPFKGYATGWPGRTVKQLVFEALSKLDRENYAYDMTQLHWCVGDNGTLDPTLPDVVRSWNERYVSPKLVIATTSELFREFEKRYGDRLPTFRGDWTPYWEDGAASSARETAINRTAAERLVQAETLWAMFNPQQYPAAEFSSAWRNIILYDEHTWGISARKDAQFHANQWTIKRAFAMDADRQSRKLLSAALGERKSSNVAAVDVFNTCCWPRTDLVVLGNEMSAAGDVVTGPNGKPVASQRLCTGELAFLAVNVPALAGRRYTISAGKAATGGKAKAEANAVASPAVSVRVDPVSGAIASLRCAAVSAELSDTKSGVGLNRYYYVLGDRVKEARQAGPAKVTIKEPGPLVASLLVESEAPGCSKLSREIRVIDGLERVDVVNQFDKKAVREKEGVHFGFAFHVPGGVMRIDIPWAVVRPEIDQMPGACKNWLTVGRWADVSNQEYGITWATLDAPLVEVGAITADKIGFVTDPAVWIDKLEPSQTLYSWVMNNHWYTNFLLEQSGPTAFRYSLLPHKQYDQVAAQRFGIECSQPLVVVPAQGAAPAGKPFLELDTPDVIVASIKPSGFGRAWIVRLFGAAGRPAKATLRWRQNAPEILWISNLAEEPITAVTGPVDVPAYGLVTLRAESGTALPNPDCARSDTSPKRKRGTANELPSLARRASVEHAVTKYQGP